MHDEEPALVYYNYRFYNPRDGRWINRDSIAEEGGWNLYAFVGNASVIYVDYLGLEVEDENDISSGFSGLVQCERVFIRKELKAGKVQNKLLNKIGIYDFKIRVILQNKKCVGCCKKNGNKGFSKAVSLSFQMEGEAGSAALNIFNLAEIRIGWYGRLGTTGGISASYSSCSNAVSGGGCVNGYAELGLIAKAASRIGSLEVGARGGINFRASVCVTTNLDKFQVKGRGCVSLRARVWASAKIWPLGKIDYNHEWQDQYCSPWIQLLQ
jgi:RHS repeat-associated protein